MNEVRMVICVCFKVVFPLTFQLCSKRRGVFHLFVRPIMEQMGYSMSCSGLLSELSVFCSLGSGRMCCFSSGARQWAIFVVARSKKFFFWRTSNGSRSQRKILSPGFVSCGQGSGQPGGVKSGCWIRENPFDLNVSHLFNMQRVDEVTESDSAFSSICGGASK